MTTAIVQGFRGMANTYSHYSWNFAEVDAFLQEQVRKWDELFTSLGLSKYTAPPGQADYSLPFSQPTDVGGETFANGATVSSTGTNAYLRVKITISRDANIKAIRFKTPAYGMSGATRVAQIRRASDNVVIATSASVQSHSLTDNDMMFIWDTPVAVPAGEFHITFIPSSGSYPMLVRKVPAANVTRDGIVTDVAMGNTGTTHEGTFVADTGLPMFRLYEDYPPNVIKGSVSPQQGANNQDGTPQDLGVTWWAFSDALAATEPVHLRVTMRYRPLMQSGATAAWHQVYPVIQVGIAQPNGTFLYSAGTFAYGLAQNGSSHAFEVTSRPVLASYAGDYLGIAFPDTDNSSIAGVLIVERAKNEVGAAPVRPGINVVARRWGEGQSMNGSPVNSFVRLRRIDGSIDNPGSFNPTDSSLIVAHGDGLANVVFRFVHFDGGPQVLNGLLGCRTVEYSTGTVVQLPDAAGVVRPYYALAPAQGDMANTGVGTSGRAYASLMRWE